MQAECRSLLGLLIWVSEAYPQIKYTVNFACGYMAEPSMSVYVVAKLALLHIYAFPTTVTWGGPGCTSLESVETIQRPFSAEGLRIYSLHMFSDANVDDKSITGGVMMLAGGAILSLSQRQHLVSPDSHTSEVNAAGTCTNRIQTIREVLQELYIQQIHPTPLYLDSLSTTFVAADKGSVKRSQHNLRRVAVLTQATEMGDIIPIHISEKDMVADGLTKPLPRSTRLRHMAYTHNYTSNLNGT